MANTPHQLQRKMDIEIDSADLTVYVKLPTLRSGRWVACSIVDVILVAAKRAKWRAELEETLRYLNGEDDE